jgi:hypothetical protein
MLRTPLYTDGDVMRHVEDSPYTDRDVVGILRTPPIQIEM